MPERVRYSKADAAYMLSMSVRTLDRLRRSGKIVGRRDGGRIYFDRTELESYSRSCPPE
ncbi:helix-turn-helix domain-containing protein [Nocardia tengchongensis]